MNREYIKWYSPSLHRDMELLVFGHAGFPMLVFPTSFGRFHEYEDRGMVHTVSPKIARGEMQLICLDSVDTDSWYNKSAHPADRLHRQNGYDAYLALEVAPFARSRYPGMTGATGCSFGGYHALNFALRHPDIVTYVVAMSGAFDVPHRFLDGYYNLDAYLHCPPDYLPGLGDEWHLSRMRRNYYVFATGSGDPLLGESRRMQEIMGAKGIPNYLDIWDGFGHDWPWWRGMAAKYLL
jgi:esterase/lipase superfamily enzyme